MSKRDQAGDKGRKQGFSVAEGVVSSPADVGRGEQTKDIFSGLWQFPVLFFISLAIHKDRRMDVHTPLQ